ncbi:MAG: KOW domain-containing RNA-binding protein [Bacillota bacterium]
METGGLECGRIVSSKAGRDQGKKFVILQVLDDRTVLVADGDLRKVANPKRKNVRHLVIHQGVVAPVGEKIKAGQEPTDKEIRQALETEFKEPEDGPPAGAAGKSERS